MQVNKTYKVAVFDENLVTRLGLAALINELPDFEVVCCKSAVPADLEKLQTIDANLISIKSLDLDIIHQIGLIKQVNKGLPIAVLAYGTDFNGQDTLLRLGIEAIIIGDITQTILNASLQCIVHGGNYYPENLRQFMIDGARQPKYGHLIPNAFTEKQKEIIQFLALGRTSKQIAETLFKSRRTIEMHKLAAMKTAGVKSSMRLVLFAIEFGVIDSPYSEKDRLQENQEFSSKLHTI